MDIKILKGYLELCRALRVEANIEGLQIYRKHVRG